MVTLLQEVLYLQIENVLCNLFLDQMSVADGCFVSLHFEMNLRKSEEVNGNERPKFLHFSDN